MSDVDEMIDAAAARMWQETVVNNGNREDGREPLLWDDASPSTKREWRSVASHALRSLDIPLETLAALRVGAWKAVPVKMTPPMFDEWWEDDWAAMLAAAPDKPGDEQ